jgi:transposase
VLLLHERLHALAEAPTADDELRKLKKRLVQSENLLRFVEVASVDPTNNKAEREIRPAVLMRKVSQGSASEAGAQTRSVLMSIDRTLKQRGVDPVAATAAALRTYTQTGTLPPLPTAKGSTE